MDLKFQKGFTLIELIITVTVLGILLALAGPSMFEILERRKIVGAADLLFADLMFAKTETIKRNQVVRVSFKNKGTTNWCYGMKLEITCDCEEIDSSQPDYCEIDGIKKVVSEGDFPNVSGTWNYTGDVTQFDARRGFANPFGTATFSIDGSSASVVSTIRGRVKICSSTGAGGYPSC